MQSTTNVSSERFSETSLGTTSSNQSEPSRSNQNLSEKQRHPHQGWIHIDEMDNN